MSYICPKCKKEIPSISNFCPFCGDKIVRDEGLTGYQRIKIYLISFLLAPLGLYWFFKYFRSDDLEKRRVAYYTLYITLIILLLSVVLVRFYIKEVSEYTDYYKSYLDVYSEMGY